MIEFLARVYTQEDLPGYPLTEYKLSRTQISYMAFRSRKPALFRVTFPGELKAAPLKPGSVCAPNYTFVHVLEGNYRTSQINQELSVATDNLGTFTINEETNSSKLGAMTLNATVPSETVEPIAVRQLAMSNNPANIISDLSLINFLARPVVSQSGVFAATDTVTTFAIIFHPSTQVATTLVANKLSGICFMRATSVFTLQVNANKFQAGRYILAHLPFGGGNGLANYITASYIMHRYTLTQITQLPHVELDINCDTEVVLRIPFRSVEYNFSIAATGADRSSDVGTVFLVPYSPLVTTAGTATASYTLFHHFEDVELSVPCIPQSIDFLPTFPIEPQMGAWAPKAIPSDREANAKAVGPVSSALQVASKVATILGKIPMLTPFSGTAAWFLDISAGVASALGFSKPLSSAAHMRMVRNVAPYGNNYDGVSTALNISMTHDNYIEPLPGFAGTDMDEMDFDFIKQVPSYFQTVSWTTADASGTILSYTANMPSTFYVGTTDATVPVKSYLPMAYIQKFFQNWRGSLIYKFKIVKTSFHSGRLIVAFSPSDPRFAAPAVTLASTQYLNRVIIDIREGNEFTLCVPYASAGNWCRHDQNTGNLVLMVLDPLVAPASVSGTIKIIWEMVGGPDLEFSAPRTMIEIPYVPTSPQSGEWDPTCNILSDTIGESSIVRSDDHARMCVGERVNSFRQLLKAYSPLMLLNYDTGVVGSVAIVLNPYHSNVAQNVAAAISLPNLRPDMFDHLSSVYLMCRGGVRMLMTKNSVTVPVTANPNSGVQVYLHHDPTHQVTSVVSNTSDTAYTLRTRPRVIYDTMTNGPSIELQVPQYSRFHSRLCSEQFVRTLAPTGNTASLTHGPDFHFELKCNDGDGSCSWLIDRAGADDCTFGGFISIPPYYNPGG